MSLLRTSSRTKDLLKATKSACSVSTQTEHSIDNLTRLHTSPRGGPGNNTTSQGLNNLPPPKLRICDKSRKVCNRNHTRNRILRNVDKIIDDHFTTRGKNRENIVNLPRESSVKGHSSEGTFQAFREIDFHLPSDNTPSSPEPQVLTNGPHKGVKEATRLRNISPARPICESGT